MKIYEKFILKIIEERGSSDALRNWLYEDYNSTYKVLDFLPRYDLLNILNNPIITKTVEQMWMGTYDLNNFMTDDISYILPIKYQTYSPVYGLTGSETLSMVKPKHFLGIYTYPIWSIMVQIREL